MRLWIKDEGLATKKRNFAVFIHVILKPALNYYVCKSPEYSERIRTFTDIIRRLLTRIKPERLVAFECSIVLTKKFLSNELRSHFLFLSSGIRIRFFIFHDINVNTRRKLNGFILSQPAVPSCPIVIANCRRLPYAVIS